MNIEEKLKEIFKDVLGEELTDKDLGWWITLDMVICKNEFVFLGVGMLSERFAYGSRIVSDEQKKEIMEKYGIREVDCDMWFKENEEKIERMYEEGV